MTPDTAREQRALAEDAEVDWLVVPRWVAAVIAITYGFAKLNGAQFLVPDYILDQRVRDVSGPWLTWYYFGYSRAYAVFIGLSEVIAGGLLAFRRTSLIGALLCLPLAGNIVIVDIAYGVGVGPAVIALMMGVCAAVVLSSRFHEIKHALVLPPSGSRRSTVASVLALAALLLFSAWFGRWNRTSNVRAPTAIDGVWEVTEPVSDSRIDRVFFELNRAHMVVFRRPGDEYEQHHFEYDPRGRDVRIWQTWLSQDSLIMVGKVGENLRRMRLWQIGEPAPDTLFLIRVAGDS